MRYGKFVFVEGTARHGPVEGSKWVECVCCLGKGRVTPARRDEYLGRMSTDPKERPS